jgi:DNA invertase Pin-like site-specific DNA recombinase
MASTRLGYARISTPDQDAALQHDALEAAGCFRVFTDVASGKLGRRPQLDALLEQLRPGDSLVVWRLDRLGRSMSHLLETVEMLEQREVALVSLQESIDTSTATGRLVFHIFGALAQFERELLRERTMAGLAAARARGRTGGRPRAMTPEKAAVARQMLASGEYSMATIAATLGVGRSTLYAYLAAEREVVEPPAGP